MCIRDSFRSAVAVATVIIQHACTDSLIRGELILLPYGGVNLETLCIGIVLILFKNNLPDHFRQVVCFDSKLLVAAQSHDRLLLSELELFIINKMQFVHTAQNVKLAELCTLWIDDRIIGGRGLGQPGEHGCFSDSDLAERFAKVNLRCGSKAICALTKIYLVDVKLQNLIFTHAVFDFKGKQYLVELASDGFFLGKKKISRHLHSNRCLLYT